ncbi:unnamed protein product [Musa acuminata subsp. malaccensis]|uniref:(wild Malaysian banana) hypothetical protein n=1 Tax=Musa acuminata subsp. malaccensis TaxID=214687 RepID=A0A804L6H7_MUSAM|nr:unnamed protein product [Musa acuminata subsp. malaccensis]
MREDVGRHHKKGRRRCRKFLAPPYLKQVLMSLMQPWLGLHKEQKCLKKAEMARFFNEHLVFFQENSLRVPAYACYLSTSAGPVIGTLYLSTARIAFCSDNPLCRNISNGQQEWAYYKVVVPLDQLRAVNPSANPRNPSDKYIQIVTMGNHEFWFMGFISYEKALKNLREALQFLLRVFHQCSH